MNKNKTKIFSFKKPEEKIENNHLSFMETQEKQVEFTEFLLYEFLEMNSRIDGLNIHSDFLEAENNIYNYLEVINKEYLLSKENEDAILFYAYIIGISVEFLFFEKDERIVEYMNKLFFILDEPIIMHSILGILNKEHLSKKSITLVNALKSEHEVIANQFIFSYMKYTENIKN